MKTKTKKMTKRATKTTTVSAAEMPKPETVLVLRKCDQRMCAYNDFQWPTSGSVEAPDWSASAVCGYGLHGLAKGEGDASTIKWRDDPDAYWVVVEVLASDIVPLENNSKCKFPRGVVVYASKDRDGAIKMIQDRHPEAACVYGQATAGSYGQATAGDSGQATAGYAGKATAGNYGFLVLSWYDRTKNRTRLEVAYVGEDGIEPNVTYQLDANHKFVKAT